MKKCQIIIIALTVSLLFPFLSRAVGSTGGDSSSPSSPNHKYLATLQAKNNSSARSTNPNHVLVRFKHTASRRAVASAHSALRAASVKTFNLVSNLHLVRLPQSTSLDAAIASYRKNPSVLYAEPDYEVKAHILPNDPSFGSLWAFQNSGQNGGTPGADIHAPWAWEMTTGNRNVVVAVIDTGIDYNHEDLAPNMWRNPGDCNANGIDDDGNGYIDDCHGINSLDRTLTPMDDNKHGTHVAGTIGAIGNNSLGVVGINWNVSLMACKFLNSYGQGYTSGAIECLDYVKAMKDKGVNIVATNNSWGGGNLSQFLWEAIEAHVKAGILFVGSAGNEGTDNDPFPVFPASAYLPNVISVAATDNVDRLSYYSNDGNRSVHLGAPGSAILSTTPGNTYGAFNGTSMAAPHVTGVAALLKAQEPSRDWKAIKNIILSSGETLPTLSNTIIRKRLDAYKALTCTDSVILTRLWPRLRATNLTVGETLNLSLLHINCAVPNGEVQVSVDPGGEAITLKDDGLNADQIAGDGIYSGQYTPSKEGIYNLTFPGGDVFSIQALSRSRPLFGVPKVYDFGYVTRVAVGDVNGDGKNDVAFARGWAMYDKGTDYYLHVSHQNSSGSLNSPVDYLAGTRPGYINSIAVGDVNNDGRADAIIAVTDDNAPQSGYIGIFYQNEAGTLDPMVKYPTSHSSLVRIGDLNNDGLPDVASIGGKTDTVNVFLQNADGSLSVPVGYNVLNSGAGMEIADVNNDGLNDIVVSSGSHVSKPAVGLLYQNRDGSLSPAVYFDVRGMRDLDFGGTRGLAVGDVNGDGLKDVVVGYDMEFRMGVLNQGQSGALKGPVSYLSPGFGNGVKVADVNYDGRNDIVATQAGNISVYLQAPNGSLFPFVSYPPPNQYAGFSGSEGMTLGDVTGDGLIDVVAADVNLGIVTYPGDLGRQEALGNVTVFTGERGWYGRGSAVSTPAGINCGPLQVCTVAFEAGTRVLITPVPDEGSVFDTWFGCPETDGKGGCILTAGSWASGAAMGFDLKNVKITVQKEGPGTIKADHAAIDCGTLCETVYPSSKGHLILSAIPDPGAMFHGWGGNCDYALDDGRCWISLFKPHTIKVSFGPLQHFVQISLGGSGKGEITSMPEGMTCLMGAVCSGGFPPGSTVTLTAAPERGSTFTGWQGGGCEGSTGPCTIVMDESEVYLAAFFTQTAMILDAEKTGSGAGTVTSSPSGINCGATCSAGFTPGAEVTLTALPGQGSRLTGWSGCYSVSGNTCTVVLTNHRSVSANFVLSNALTVTTSGNGTVTSTPPGIECGKKCFSYFNPDTHVILTAKPFPDFAFAYWTGGCTGVSPVCSLTLSSDAALSAVFIPLKSKQYNLSVVRQRVSRGEGTITSADGLIDCGKACAHQYYQGTPVTLSATAAGNSVFTGWSGPCSGTDPCTITMDQARTVKAAFTGPAALKVVKARRRKGNGTVTSHPPGIDCGNDCQESYPANTPVTLTATPDPGSAFTGWTPKSVCSGTGACTVTMTRAKSVTATFTGPKKAAGDKGDDEEGSVIIED
jgi:subtilisin family serine protease